MVVKTVSSIELGKQLEAGLSHGQCWLLREFGIVAEFFTRRVGALQAVESGKIVIDCERV